jgi:hypothetical protein
MFYDSKNRNKIENRNKTESKQMNIMKINKIYRFINMNLINHRCNKLQNFSKYPENIRNLTYLI